MDLTDFKDSLSQNHPPTDISIMLEALWYDGKGNWDHAHALVNDLTSKDAAYVHAYLHRKEGDDWNASYWYRNADKTKPTCSLDKEWENMVEYFL
ncbi:hypothetical protein DN752_03685 [Echinicola strongylocentroti]|uniref:Uncharacterized protein n=1 Tax=Echinicola strongylocentroti TaxID=1795355 RepID=A0A2Z4IEH1_9BACT|nr:hypothetical protein [Echinicola strongylocentroti]AWW29314.1 hypothetical protein DN752_03685 [Echinicola strongylocentroti]